jgi:hypothetical protein
MIRHRTDPNLVRRTMRCRATSMKAYFATMSASRLQIRYGCTAAKGAKAQVRFCARWRSSVTWSGRLWSVRFEARSRVSGRLLRLWWKTQSAPKGTFGISASWHSGRVGRCGSAKALADIGPRERTRQDDGARSLPGDYAASTNRRDRLHPCCVAQAHAGRTNPNRSLKPGSDNSHFPKHTIK